MFEDRTTANLKKEVLAEINPATGVSSMAGSYADAVAGPLCQAVSSLYKALPGVLSMLFVDESSGKFLDLVGRDYLGLTRREGTKATCSVTLKGTSGTTLYAGTGFLTADGLTFRLVSTVTIPITGSIVAKLEAEQEGSIYNIAPNSLVNMYVNIAGLSSYTNGQAEGGTDRESDQSLYQRIVEARQRPDTSGNGWDYRSWALEVDGVGETKSVELAQGAGRVEVMVIHSNDNPATEDMMGQVKSNIEEKRPIGATVTVTTPTGLPIAVSAVVTVSGTTTGAVQTALEKSMQTYLHQLIEKKYQTIYNTPEADTAYTLYYNRVLALLLTIDGVETFSTLTVNGGTEDVTIPANKVPKLGTVKVT